MLDMMKIHDTCYTCSKEVKYMMSTYANIPYSSCLCNCVSKEAEIELTQDVEDMGNWASGQIGEWNVEKT